MVRVVVYTTDPRKSYQFKPWSDDRPKLPPARDDLGNSYKAVPGGLDEELARKSGLGGGWFGAGGVKPAPRCLFGGGNVTSEVARRDCLFFEAPAPKAKQLVIDLPAGNVDAPGVLRFTAPVPK